MGNKKVFNAGLAFVTGLAAGYVASLFMPEEKRDQQKKKIQKTTNVVSQTVVNEVAERVLGTSGDEAREQMQAVMSDFQARVEEVAKTVDSIDTKKYQKLVTDFGKSLQKNYDLTADQSKKLKEYLKSDYESVVKKAVTKKTAKK